MQLLPLFGLLCHILLTRRARDPSGSVHGCIARGFTTAGDCCSQIPGKEGMQQHKDLERVEWRSPPRALWASTRQIVLASQCPSASVVILGTPEVRRTRQHGTNRRIYSDLVFCELGQLLWLPEESIQHLFRSGAPLRSSVQSLKRSVRFDRTAGHKKMNFRTHEDDTCTCVSGCKKTSTRPIEDK